MTGLITITPQDFGGRKTNAVTARDFYQRIGLDLSHWNRWAKQSIEENPFAVEGEDWAVLATMAKTPVGGRPSKDYALSIPFAKKLAMKANTPEGELVRDYFLECERQAQAPVLNPANLSRLQLITMALEAEQEREALACQVETLAPKAVALDRISTHSQGSLCPTNAAKALQVRPGMLFSWLQEHHWIYRRPGGSAWLGYQDRIQSGLLEHKVATISCPDGSERVKEQVLITAKGLAKLASIFGEAS